MKTARMAVLLVLAAAVAVSGCEFQRKSATSPTPALEPSGVIPSLLGEWSATSAAPSAGGSSTSCSSFTWTITEQTPARIAGTFTAKCLDNADLTGSGTADLSGSTVRIAVSGNGTMPGVSSCPFSVSGTGTIDGDVIRIPYSGSTCLGPLSGTYNLSRGYIQGPPPPPVMQSPADGSTLTTRRPVLVVGNVTPQAPSDTMQYEFEVGTDAALANRTISAVVDAGAGGTTGYTVPHDLPYSSRYYWRVRTIGGGRRGSFTASRSFVTPADPGPPPPPPPAGNELDMRVASVLNSPLDLPGWPITTRLTLVDLRPTGVHVEFSKRDGPGRWPDVFPPGWDEPLQYTLGMCLNISNRWYCSAPIQFWYGLDESGGPPSDYAHNWFYDPGRWGPMSGHQPVQGEVIGFFVCAGDCRNTTTGHKSVVKERSNVVLLPFPGSRGGSFRF